MQVKKAVKISANAVFTRRRVVGLTVAELLPYRPHWTPRSGGFEARLSGALPDGRPWQQTMQLVSSPCHFGGWRHYLWCPGCGHTAMSLFWGSTMFVCRRCAGLRYTSKIWRDPIRLMHHYCGLMGHLARPGRRPARYYRAALNEELAGIRWARHVIGWADRVDVRREKREEGARAAAIAWATRTPPRGNHNLPAGRRG